MNDVKHFQRVTRSLKTARRTLGALVQTISDEITATMDEMLPVYYHQGFASLPDELLASILEESGNDPVEMQMLSWRFYRIVSNLPRLWTTIRSGEQGDRWNLALKRSCEQTLDVDILVDELEPRDLRALRPHWHRVGVLRLEADDEQIEMMNSQFSSLGTMHRLRGLSLDLRLSEGDDVGHPTAEYTFYEDWHTPNLTELFVSNIIPIPIRGMSLRHLDMLLCDASISGVPWDVTRLHTLLASCQALEQLSIDFEDAAVLVGEFGPVELPSLRYFKLTVATDMISETHTFMDFVSNLTITNVEEMYIVTRYLAAIDMTPSLELIFSSSTRYPNLTTLDFSVMETVAWDVTSLQRIILERLPKLSHFTIEAPGLDIVAEDILSARPFPPLRTLCFRRCYRAYFAFFMVLFERLHDKFVKAEENSPDREFAIQLIGCSHLLKEDVVRLARRFDIRVEWQS